MNIVYLIGEKEMSDYEISSGGAEDTDDDDFMSARNSSLYSKKSGKDSNSGEPGTFYEEIDKFSLKSEEIIDEEFFSVDKIVEGIIGSFLPISSVRRHLGRSTQADGNDNLSKVLTSLEKRKKKIERMMATAPYRRSMDKFAYCFGTNFALFFAFTLSFGHPSICITFTTIVMSMLMIDRLFSFF